MTDDTPEIVREVQVDVENLTVHLDPDEFESNGGNLYGMLVDLLLEHENIRFVDDLDITETYEIEEY